MTITQNKDNYNTGSKKIELLAPVGSFANLRAAVYSGANAVYLGMDKFNARESAVNFDKEMLKKAIQLCKTYNIKIYLTANTLVKDSELAEFFEQIEYAYAQGIDGVIIQDPSFIEVIKTCFPDLHVHISTQAGIMNSLHANLFSSAERINLARELDKKNIERIRKNFTGELEVFVHGALCVSVSGSCLFSSLLGGRSGNRGKCAQPCRKFYTTLDKDKKKGKEGYLLSTKELCLIDRIPELIEMGIDSLKIEGRMRTPHYTATMTSNYREVIDSVYTGKFKVSEVRKNNMAKVFSRGFTEGKFANEKENMFNTTRASADSEIKNNIYPVEAKYTFIEKRKMSCGLPGLVEKDSSGKKMVVRVHNKKDALIADKYADIICLDIYDKDFLGLKKLIKKPIYAVTPRIMFDDDFLEIKNKLKELAPAGIFAGNWGMIEMIKELKLSIPVILDYNCNCFNDYSIDYYSKLGALPIISPELSISELLELKNKDFLVFGHGKIRLMTLVHDFSFKEMQDDKGFNFKVEKIKNGSEILNEKELGLFNKLRELVKSGVNQIYIDSESTKEVEFEDVLVLYRQIVDGKSVDASKIQKNYVLGWSKTGVL